MKGYRKLKIGEVIREGDIFINRWGKKTDAKIAIPDVIDTKFSELNHQFYRPIKKPVEKWEVFQPAGMGYPSSDKYWVVGDKHNGERARVWTIKDAKAICRAMNKTIGSAENKGE